MLQRKSFSGVGVNSSAYPETIVDDLASVSTGNLRLAMEPKFS